MFFELLADFPWGDTFNITHKLRGQDTEMSFYQQVNMVSLAPKLNQLAFKREYTSESTPLQVVAGFQE